MLLEQGRSRFEAIEADLALLKYFQSPSALVTNFFGGETFSDPNSSQSQALEWLTLDSVSSDASVDQVIQRFVLATLNFSTKGATWAATWLEGPECFWDRVECNDDGDIVSLALHLGGLSGIIPAEIGALSQLLLDSFRVSLDFSLTFKSSTSRTIFCLPRSLRNS
jgi:hypothetical protein